MSSITDQKDYLASVTRAVQDEEFYKNSFRRDREINSVFEHVSIPQAWNYLVEIQKSNVPADLFDVYDLSRFHKLNDSIGGPELHHFGGAGLMAPTTMRYVYHMSDLIQKFGSDKLRNAVIVEIGVGYGGLCRLIRSVFPDCEYHVVDLEPVTQLMHKFNQFDTNVHLHPYEEFTACGSLPLLPKIDLVISNFAWSECTPFVRKLYMDQILKHALSGYMILNTYLTSAEMQATAETLKGELMEEVPDTNSGRNRLLVWNKI